MTIENNPNLAAVWLNASQESKRDEETSLMDVSDFDAIFSLSRDAHTEIRVK